MAPGTRTPNGRKLHDEYAGLPRDLNTRLAAKIVTRLKAVFSLRTATEARAKHQTNEHRSKAFNASHKRRPVKGVRWRPKAGTNLMALLQFEPIVAYCYN